MTLEVRNIAKSYRAGADLPLTVLAAVSLTLPRAETLAITGPSGSGKTTLLNIIGALDRPDAGSVLYDGTDLSTLSDTQRAHFRNRTLGFIFQAHYLLPQCTVLENCLIPVLAQASKEHLDQAHSRAEQLLSQIGLGDRLGAFPAELSGGQQQRVAVIRALVNEPQLVLADEPTGSLDNENADMLMELFLGLQRQQGFSLIVVTHSLSIAQRLHHHLRLHNHVLTPRET